ncbi:MAG: NADH-quinone oxidoreductase subunit NuoE [Gammaproteobacteria bacterium]|nr:NADH-quinone oxidoreductase subunit NuoE [Gammaproteobacteria bacterium]
MLSEAIVAKIEKEAAKYPTRRAVVKSALRYAQAERGWVDDGVINDVAQVLGLEPIEVHEVATFYDLFYTEPVGRIQLRVCTNVSCMLCGSDEVMAHLESRLGIGPGETTADGRFTLIEVECLGACGGAPMMMIGDRYHENLDAERIDAILAELEQADG